MLSGINNAMNNVMSPIYKVCNAISNNKATIAKVAVGVSAVGLAVLLLDNRNTLYGVRRQILEMAYDLKTPCQLADYPKGCSVNLLPKTSYGYYFSNCMPRADKFELTLPYTEKSEMEAQMRAFYNNATNWGSDLFSRFTFMGTQSKLNDFKDHQISLLICRETLLAQFKDSFFPAA